MSLITHQGRTFLLCEETGMQKLARMHMKTGKGFVDPAAMTNQMREDWDSCILPPLTILCWQTILVITKDPEDGPGIAQIIIIIMKTCKADSVKNCAKRCTATCYTPRENDQEERHPQTQPIPTLSQINPSIQHSHRQHQAEANHTITRHFKNMGSTTTRLITF